MTNASIRSANMNSMNIVNNVNILNDNVARNSIFSK